MTYYIGHQSEYGYYVKFNTGSFGISSSVGDIYVNDYLIQNQELLYAMSSQIKVNYSRYIEPAEFTFGTSQSFATSIGPFDLDFLPDGRPQPLYVSVDFAIVDNQDFAATGSLTVHLRQAANTQGAFFSYSEFGTVDTVGATNGFQDLNVSGSSHSKILEINPRSLGPLNVRQTYISRSLSSSKEPVNELPVFLDFYCKLTGSQPPTTPNKLILYGVYAHTFVPRVSGSWTGPTNP